MLKSLLALLFLNVFLYAIEIDFIADKKIDVSQDEITQFKAQVLKQRIRIDDKEAKRVLMENRILANYYLKNEKVPQFFKLNLVHKTEKLLAKMLVDKYEEELELSDDILLSYYRAKKDEFYRQKQILLNVYKFKDFDSALEMYMAKRDKMDSLDSYAKEHEIKMIEQLLEVSNMHQQIRSNLRNLEDENYLVPPQKWADGYIVVHAVRFVEENYMPYEEIKEDIRERLIVQNRKNARRKLMQEYTDKFQPGKASK
jgi:predicted transcriptional regulator